jgi:hypothetical protein
LQKSRHSICWQEFDAACAAKGEGSNRAAADAFAANVLPIVRQIQASGATTTRAIAAALNARGIRTVRGMARLVRAQFVGTGLSL